MTQTVFPLNRTESSASRETMSGTTTTRTSMNQTPRPTIALFRCRVIILSRATQRFRNGTEEVVCDTLAAHCWWGDDTEVSSSRQANRFATHSKILAAFA